MKAKPVIVGIRFSQVGKIYHFDASNVNDVQVGSVVVVETSRGKQLGQVVQVVGESEREQEGGLKVIERHATPRDLILRQSWQLKEPGVLTVCQSRVKELNLKGVKIIAAEYNLDGSHLNILFGTETEEKAELKSLRQDMQKLFTPTQVELRAIGPRDVAKIYGGMGACGLEIRCCTRFLTDFNSISIKMAKEQGISLTPAEITGMCGRLRCCLNYEYQNYVDARQKLPKRNRRVNTPLGEGKVVDVAPLRGVVYVEMSEGGVREFQSETLTLLDDNSIQDKPNSQTVSNPQGRDQSNRPRSKKGLKHR
jgi:cell fate regulator YaaT (PSP1 superfamily)